MPGPGRGRWRRDPDARSELILQSALRERRGRRHGGADAHHGGRALPAQRAQVREAWAPHARRCWPRPPTLVIDRVSELRAIHDFSSRAAASPCSTRSTLPSCYDETPSARRPWPSTTRSSASTASKYFNMTAGACWLVVPEALVLRIERLAQNLFICASAVSQQAALACFRSRQHRRVRTPPRRIPRAPRFLHPRARCHGPERASDARRRLTAPGPTAARGLRASGVQGSWDHPR